MAEQLSSCTKDCPSICNVPMVWLAYGKDYVQVEQSLETKPLAELTAMASPYEKHRSYRSTSVANDVRATGGEMASGGAGMPLEDLPFVSVIIPMRNEAAHITECLQSVVAQDYPKDLMEVLVVDGMSQDSSREIVSDFATLYGFVRLLRNPKKVTTSALNMGIAESRGDVIVRVDAHCSIESDYVYSCVKALQETGAENVGGLMRPEGTSFLEKAIALAMCSPFGVGSGKFHYWEREMFVDTVYLGAYRKEVFEKIGLYDEDAHYSEDDELNYRLIKSGGKIFLSPQMRSHYYPRSSLSTLWKQYYNYGRGKVRTTRKHGRPPSWRHLVPGLFVFALLGSSFFSIVNLWFLWLLAGILGTYLLAAMVVSARTAAFHGWRYLPILPIVFLTMHTSYGFGFLSGTIRLLVLGRVW